MGGNSPAISSTGQNAIAMRTDQNFARRAQSPRGGSRSTIQPAALTEMRSTKPFKYNAGAEFAKQRIAMRKFQYPGKSFPKFQEANDAVREEGEGQQTVADERDNQIANLADQANQAQDISETLVTKSQGKSALRDTMQDYFNMLKKKWEEWMAEVKAELYTKATVGDMGEGALAINSGGVGASLARSFSGIFSKSLEKYSSILNKIGLPIPKYLKFIGGAGTAFQFFLWTGLIAIILFSFIFQVLIFAAVADGLANPLSNAAELMEAVVQ